jgi:PhnB protein
MMLRNALRRDLRAKCRSGYIQRSFPFVPGRNGEPAQPSVTLFTNNRAKIQKGKLGRSAADVIQPEETAMATKVKPVPDGYHTLTPYLVVDGAERIIQFMKNAFGAQSVHEPMMRPDGKIMHAELKIGDSVVMIADASERAKATSAMLHVYMPNVDAVYQKALKAGGTSVMEPTDMFYGDRSGGVTDPAGNQWHIGTHVEDVSPAELKKRATEFMKQQSKAA